jgi:tight adherence protein B
MVGIVYKSSPGFFLAVKDHPAFVPIAILVGILILLQGIILKRLTNFDF